MNDYKELIVHIATVMALEDECGQKELADLLEKAVDAIEQLVKERDAAVEDLKKNNKCCICKHKKENIQDCQHYSSCGLVYIHFEWRGIQDETD